MNHDVIMNWDLSILVKNENELLWSAADNVILVVYPVKFIFSCLSSSGWIGQVQIGSGHFGFGSASGQ